MSTSQRRTKSRSETSSSGIRTTAKPRSRTASIGAKRATVAALTTGHGRNPKAATETRMSPSGFSAVRVSCWTWLRRPDRRPMWKGHRVGSSCLSPQVNTTPKRIPPNRVRS